MEKHSDINELFEKIESFPFPAISLSDLEKFANSISEFLPHISDQKTARVKSKLEAATDPVAKAELEFELQQIASENDSILAHTVWGGFMVSTCAAYEFSIEQVFKHWRELAPSSEIFKPKKNESFLDAAEKYSQQVLGIPLHPPGLFSEILRDLKSLRNSFAHKGSLLSGLHSKLRNSIINQSHPWLKIKVMDDRWLANEISARLFLKAAKLDLSHFGDIALEKRLKQIPS